MLIFLHEKKPRRAWWDLFCLSRRTEMHTCTQGGSLMHWALNAIVHQVPHPQCIIITWGILWKTPGALSDVTTSVLQLIGENRSTWTPAWARYWRPKRCPLATGNLPLETEDGGLKDGLVDLALPPATHRVLKPAGLQGWRLEDRRTNPSLDWGRNYRHVKLKLTMKICTRIRARSAESNQGQ